MTETIEQPGGSIQYEVPLAITQLIKDGFLKDKIMNKNELRNALMNIGVSSFLYNLDSKALTDLAGAAFVKQFGINTTTITGVLASAGAVTVISGAIYVVTDVITIQGKTIREHLQDAVYEDVNGFAENVKEAVENMVEGVKDVFE